MWKNDNKNIGDSVKAAVSSTVTFECDPIYHDDIEAIRHDPTSAKATEARAKLTRVAVSDDTIWREVMSSLRKNKVTTNLCASITFNDSLVEQIVIKELEKNKKIETRPISNDAGAASMLKFVRNPFFAGGGRKALNEEEVLSSLRCVLKKPTQQSNNALSRRRSESVLDNAGFSGIGIVTRSDFREKPISPTTVLGVGPCNRRDSHSSRGSFTLSLPTGNIGRSKSVSATMEVGDSDNLYDVCRSITLENDEPCDANQPQAKFRSFMSTAIKRCSFNDKSGLTSALAAVRCSISTDSDEGPGLAKRQSLRGGRRSNRSSWSTTMRWASGLSLSSVEEPLNEENGDSRDNMCNFIDSLTLPQFPSSKRGSLVDQPLLEDFPIGIPPDAEDLAKVLDSFRSSSSGLESDDSVVSAVSSNSVSCTVVEKMPGSFGSDGTNVSSSSAEAKASKQRGGALIRTGSARAA